MLKEWLVTYNPILENNIDDYHNLTLGIEKIMSGRKALGVSIENLKVKGKEEHFVLNVYGIKFFVERISEEFELLEYEYILTFEKDDMKYVVSKYEETA